MEALWTCSTVQQHHAWALWLAFCLGFTLALVLVFATNRAELTPFSRYTQVMKAFLTLNWSHRLEADRLTAILEWCGLPGIRFSNQESWLAFLAAFSTASGAVATTAMTGFHKRRKRLADEMRRDQFMSSLMIGA